MSLGVVILIQAFPITIPTDVLTYTAEAKEETRAESLEQEVRERTIEIYKQNYPLNMQAAETQALWEQQDKLQKLAKLVPERDYKDLRQALDVFENTRSN